MKPRWRIVLLSAVIGAFMLAVIAAATMHITYKPDSFYGDLRAIVVPVAFGYGFIIGGVIGAGVGLLINAWISAQEANRDFQRLVAQQATMPQSRDAYIWWRVMPWLAPILLVCVLIGMKRELTRYQLNQHTNPWSRGTSNRGQVPLATPGVTPTLGTEEALASTLGALFYPRAEVLPQRGTLRRPHVPFSQVMLTSTDAFDVVIGYYESRLKAVDEKADYTLFRGLRPRDRVDTFVKVQRYEHDALVYISISSG